ncbi:MAG TPA: molybdopterin cofactor-binding domain-containing protein [Gemmataceae bacterium]|nr:molybdopterin cofactor-binding domain-containing protein [Gemmataceae bacterium]
MSEVFLPEPALEPERYELHEGPRYQFELDRRDFCKLVGGGILVCLVLGETAAQQPGRGGRGGFGGGAAPREIGAWLHVDEKGQVTAFTGKVEIGQNIRTSLAQVVAEELRLPVTSVRMVMADTDLTPNDMGTFGSMTTPNMASQLRRVAAAARELLIEMAADRAMVDRAALVVADGKVTNKDTNQSFTFGELTKGQKLTKTIEGDAPTTPVKEWKVEGTPIPKVNGRDMVTGKHQYTPDVKRPGMLFAKVLRPATLNATLVSADLKPAQALPGVVAVRDGVFVGVAAPSEAIAEQAVAAIKAEWKSSPQISAKELFASLKQGGGAGGGTGGEGFGGRGGQNTGSIEKGLAAADHKLNATYTIAYIAHAPLEPRAAVAEWSDGKLTVWVGTQTPFRFRSELARTFSLAPEKVRVIVPDMGSAYGGKHTSEHALEAARIAKAAGKPVKLVWTREEEFTWAYFRPAGVIDVTSGVSKDGTITAWEFHNYNSGGSAIRSPYEAANQRVEFHGARSPLRQGSYRGLAATANHFARESHVDELAHVVGLDPLAFRLKNLKSDRLRAVLQAAATKFGWGKIKPAPGQGFGIAAGTEKGSYVATCAEVFADVAKNEMKIVRLVTGFECGAILNPDGLKNQVEGAVVQGLGGALFEAINFADGKILNPRFSSYRVPRFGDVPILETVLLDRKDLASAGAGETPIVAMAPAVGNAIFAATGIRLRSMPMMPNGLKAAAEKA